MKHFLAISDLSSGEVQDLLDLAIKLKRGIFQERQPALFQGQGAGYDLPEAQPADARLV